MKTRLDVFLVEKGYFTTRNKAKAAIENGDILVDDTLIKKSSFLVEENTKIEIIKQSIPYVSRGGLKLEKALKVFKLDVKDKYCLDIGASTGGFTDCLLQHGAKMVYALDVGTNQLVENLKNDERVVCLEQVNFRDINVTEYKQKKLQIITADVSFISLTYLFENVSKIMQKDGFFVALIKPQFETLRKEHNKNGVVNDKNIHLRIISNLKEEAMKNNLYLNKLDYSPIRGEKAGNIEYLSLFSFNPKNITINTISDIIDVAFKELR